MVDPLSLRRTIRDNLPRAREAVIPTDELVGYALDPEYPRGRHKARVFAAALGIRQPDCTQ